MNRNRYRLAYRQVSNAQLPVPERVATRLATMVENDANWIAPIGHYRCNVKQMLSWVVTLALLTPMGVSHQVLAQTLPVDPTVSVGAGRVSRVGNTLTVNQHTKRLGIDWQSFNIGAGNTVNFVQPDASSIALNRVVGNTRSEIYGALNANGRVFLVNQNGIVFGKTAQVNVGALLATTQDISNEDFAADRFQFKGDSNAEIINQGNLRADHGSIVLSGTVVKNDGTIATPNGRTTLAAGERVSLSIDELGLIEVAVDQAKLNVLIESKGLISADNGSVYLTARGKDMLMLSAINLEGVINAHDGNVVLDGGTASDSGSVVAANARINVSSAEGMGGTVILSGERVGLLDETFIDAHGKLGGGRVVVGGDQLHKVDDLLDVRFAAETIISDGSVVDISSAQGNGGFLETSGQYLNMQGNVLGGSGAGKLGGQWLIDPNNITIGSAANANIGTNITASRTTWLGNATNTNSVVNNDSLSQALDHGANIEVRTNGPGNILVSGEITAQGAANLTLNATGNLDIKANISLTHSTAGHLTLMGAYVNSSAAGGINTSTGLTIENQAKSGASTLLGEISGSGNLTKNGAGTLILSANNSLYTGAMTINNGTLAAAGVTTRPVFGNASSITVNAHGKLTGTSWRNPYENPVILNGGTLDLYTGASYLSFLAPIQLTADSLLIARATRASISTRDINLGSHTLTINAASAYGDNQLGTLGVISGTGGIIKNGKATFSLAGNNTYTGATVINQGALILGVGGNSGSLAQTSSLVNHGTLGFNRNDTYVFNQVIAGTGSVRQIGAGTTRLTARNTYSGNTTINLGTLEIGNGGSIEQSSNIITHANFAINRSDDLIWEKQISGTGNFIQNGNNTVTLTGANTYTGSTTVNEGTLVLGNGSAHQMLGEGDVIIHGNLVINQSGLTGLTNIRDFFLGEQGNFTLIGASGLNLSGRHLRLDKAANINDGNIVLTSSGLTQINGNLAASGKGSTITFNNTGALYTNTGANITADGDIKQVGAGLSYLNGAEINSASGNISFLRDLVVAGGENHFTANFGNLTFAGNVSGGAVVYTDVGQWKYVANSPSLDYLLVGGGGAGGSAYAGRSGGGGGGGGFITGTGSLIQGHVYEINVGAGGSTSGESGASSSLGNLIALGGGAGGSAGNFAKRGGSGGGGSIGFSTLDTYWSLIRKSRGSAAGAGGESGGNGTFLENPTSYYGGSGGGGGAGGNGGEGTSDALLLSGTGGSGGIGKSSNLSGITQRFSGGGGGGVRGNVALAEARGQDGGGDGALSDGTFNGRDARANTGGGGGGASLTLSGQYGGSGGKGGSGIAVIRENLSSATLRLTGKNVVFTGNVTDTSQVSDYHNRLNTLVIEDANVTGKGSILANTLQFNPSAGKTYTLDNTIIGSTHVAQNGAGTTRFTSNHTYTGTTTINGGTLQLGNGGDTGMIAPSAKIVNNAHLVIHHQNNINLTQVIEGHGTLTQAGTGTTTLSGSNTYAGNTVVRRGKLQAGNTQAFGAKGASMVEVKQGAWLDLSSLNVNIGGLSGDGGVMATAAVSLTAGSNHENHTFSGKIQDDISLVKQGDGTLTLSGNNTYTGSTTINGGTLQVGDNGTSGTLGKGDVINNANLTFNQSGAITLQNTLHGQGNLTVLAGGDVRVQETIHQGNVTLIAGKTYGAGEAGHGTVTLLEGKVVNATSSVNLYSGNTSALNTASNYQGGKIIIAGKAADKTNTEKWYGANATDLSQASTGQLNVFYRYAPTQNLTLTLATHKKTYDGHANFAIGETQGQIDGDNFISMAQALSLHAGESQVVYRQNANAYLNLNAASANAKAVHGYHVDTTPTTVTLHRRQANIILGAGADKVYDTTTHAAKPAFSLTAETGGDQGFLTDDVDQFTLNFNAKFASAAAGKKIGINLYDVNISRGNSESLVSDYTLTLLKSDGRTVLHHDINDNLVGRIDNAAEADIKKAVVTVGTAATVLNKTYDGTTEAHLANAATWWVNYGDQDYRGKVASAVAYDNIRSHLAFQDTHANKSVGVDIAHFLNDISNYSFSDSTAQNRFNTTTSAAITPRSLTVSATTDRKTYDGSTQSSPFATASGWADRDSANGNLTQTFRSTHALGEGASRIVADTLTDASIQGGGLLADYHITYQDIFGTVQQREVNVELARGRDKTYDGTTTANANIGFTWEKRGVNRGLVNADDLTLTLQNATFQSARAGEQSMDVDAILTHGNAWASDYLVKVNHFSGGNTLLGYLGHAANITNATQANIAKRVVFVDAQSDRKTYDGNNTSQQAVAVVEGTGDTGLLSGERLSGLSQSFFSRHVLGTHQSHLIANTDAANVSGGIVASQISDYRVVARNAAQGTIDRATLTITLNPTTLKQGETYTPTFTYQGLQGSDTAQTLGVTPVVSGVDTAKAGRYLPIIVAPALNDYDVILQSNAVNVNAPQSAPTEVDEPKLGSGMPAPSASTLPEIPAEIANNPAVASLAAQIAKRNPTLSAEQLTREVLVSSKLQIDAVRVKEIALPTSDLTAPGVNSDPIYTPIDFVQDLDDDASADANSRGVDLIVEPKNRLKKNRSAITCINGAVKTPATIKRTINKKCEEP